MNLKASEGKAVTILFSVEFLVLHMGLAREGLQGPGEIVQ